jgi:hypothetical protein
LDCDNTIEQGGYASYFDMTNRWKKSHTDKGGKIHGEKEESECRQRMIL